jgi:muconate cycloisomerase
VQDALTVLWTLASGDTAKDIEEAKELLTTKRHNTFKLKIGRNDPAVDIAHVIGIKKGVGANVKITVDINQAWDEQTAKRSIAILQDAGIDLIEQPIIKENFEGLARLTQLFTVPIMADEAVTGPQDAFKLAKIFGGSVFALKIAKAGGLYNVLKTAAIAEAAGIALYGGTMLEGTIGTAASAHAFATLGHLAWGTELFGPLLLTDDIVKRRIVYADGVMQLPDGPGLGLELDEDKFNQYRRKN